MTKFVLEDLKRAEAHFKECNNNTILFRIVIDGVHVGDFTIKCEPEYMPKLIDKQPLDKLIDLPWLLRSFDQVVEEKDNEIVYDNEGYAIRKILSLFKDKFSINLKKCKDCKYFDKGFCKKLFIKRSGNQQICSSFEYRSEDEDNNKKPNKKFTLQDLYRAECQFVEFSDGAFVYDIFIDGIYVGAIRIYGMINDLDFYPKEPLKGLTDLHSIEKASVYEGKGIYRDSIRKCVIEETKNHYIIEIESLVGNIIYLQKDKVSLW